MVENPSCNAGDTGSIPGQGTKIPCATGQLSPCAATTALWSLHATARENPVCRNEEPTRYNERSLVLQVRPDAANK